jgi:hypothetical protein
MPDILPLENGDRLSRAEFERRYHAMPQVKKAELIEGVVYMQWQVRSAAHAGPHSQIITWLGVYAAATPGVEVSDNGRDIRVRRRPRQREPRGEMRAAAASFAPFRRNPV